MTLGTMTIHYSENIEIIYTIYICFKHERILICFLISVFVATIPCKHTSVTSAFCYHSTIRSSDFHVCIIAQSYDGNQACIVWSNGIWIGIDIIICHRF